MKLLMDMYKCVTVDCEVKSKIVSCAVGDSEGLPFNREMRCIGSLIACAKDGSDTHEPGLQSPQGSHGALQFHGGLVPGPLSYTCPRL